MNKIRDKFLHNFFGEPKKTWSRLTLLFVVLLLLVSSILLYAFSSRAAAANCYWVGDTSPANWNDATHWSSSAGGAGSTCDGGVVPGIDDTVYFTSDNTNDANINDVANMHTLDIGAGYTGVITQQAGNAVNVGTTLSAGTITQADGTFTGGNSNIDLNGSYNQSGGIFTSTSADFSLTMNFTISGGTFNDGGGTVVFDMVNNYTYDVVTTETFNNVTKLATWDHWFNLSTGDTMVVDGTLNITGGGFNGPGIVDAKEDINQAAGADTTPTPARLNFANDALAQTYTLSGGDGPYLYLDSAADANDSIVFNADANLFGLNITAGFSGAVQITDNGNAISIGKVNSGGFTLDANVTVDDNIATIYGFYTQSDGIFTAAASVTLYGDFTKTGGTFNEGVGTFTFAPSSFYDYDVVTTETFYNVILSPSSEYKLDIATGDTLVIDGTLTLTNGGFNGPGIIDAKGDINQGVGADYGTARLNFADDGVVQTYTVSGGTGPYLYLDSAADANDSIVFNAAGGFYGINITATFSGTVPIIDNGYAINLGENGSGGIILDANVTVDDNITVNYGNFTQSDGIYTAAATLSLYGHFTKTGGTFNEGTGTLTFRCSNFKDFNVITTETLYNVEISATNSGYGIDVATGDTMVVDGTLTLTNGFLNGPGIVDAKGDINQAITADLGTARLNFANDAVVQTYTISGGEGLYLYLDSAPDANDSVIFNAAGRFYGLNITAGFSGTVPITDNGYAITLGDNEYGGIVLDANVTVDENITVIYGSYSQSDGIFTAAPTLSLSSHFTKTGGTFNEGTGTLTFRSSTFAVFNVVGTETLYNVILNSTNTLYGLDIASGDTMVVDGALTLTNGYLKDPGTIEAKGAVTIDTTFDAGDGIITLNGSTDQTMTISSGLMPTGVLSVTKAIGTAYVTGSGTLHNVNLTQGTLEFVGGNTFTFDDADTMTTSAGTDLRFAGTAGNLVTLRSDAAAQWDLNVNASGTYYSNYVDVEYSNALPGREITTYNSTNSFNNDNWVFSAASLVDVVGTCQKFDQSANCADSETIKVAVGSGLESPTATTSGGAFTFSNVPMNSGDVVTIFVDAVADSLEANAVTKWDGAGNITGVLLYEEHLTVGSADNQTITNSDLLNYDNSASANEDIFFDVDVSNDLTVDATAQSAQEELYVVASNTYRPDSASSGNVVTTHLENAGTITGDSNTFTIAGDLALTSGQSNTGTLNVAGAFTVEVAATGGTSVVTLNGTTDQTYTINGGTLLSGAFTINKSSGNITLENTSATDYSVIHSASTMNVATLFLKASSTGNMTFDVATNNPTVNLTADLDYTGIGGGTESVSMGSGIWSVGGNVDLTGGTVVAGNSTLTLNGAANQTLTSNSQSFYNLSSTNASADPGLTFADGATVTNMFTAITPSSFLTFTAGTTSALNDITLNGQAAGSQITVQSTAASDANWNVTATTQTDVSFVTVSYNNASSGSEIGAANGTNTEGTSVTNWNFVSNVAPVNNSLAFTNPNLISNASSSNQAVSDNETEWIIRAKVTDTNGLTDIDYIEVRLANNSDSKTPFDSLKFRWTEATDSFAEIADTQDAIRLTSAASDSSFSNNQWTVDFKIKIDSKFEKKDKRYKAELYSLDDSALSDLDTFANFYRVSEPEDPPDEDPPDEDPPDEDPPDEDPPDEEPDDGGIIEKIIDKIVEIIEDIIEIIIEIVDAIVEETKEVIKVTKKGVTKVAKVVSEEAEEVGRISDETNAAEALITPILASSLIALIVLFTDFLILQINLREMFLVLSNYVLTLIGARRKNKLGVVYDYESKEPVSGAIVNIHNQETLKLVSSSITDKSGRFFFTAKKGKYVMSVIKPGYLFPSHKTSKDRNLIEDVYIGQTITISGDIQALNYQVPIEPTSGAKSKKTFASIMFLSGVLRICTLTVGSIFGVSSLLFNPTFSNYLISLLYALLWTLELIIRNRQLKFSKIKDRHTNQPISLALARMTSAKGRVLKTYISDETGKFMPYAPKGSLEMKIDRTGYQSLIKSVKEEHVTEGKTFRLTKDK